MAPDNDEQGMVTLPDISLRQLEYLVAVAESSTWSAAAQRVGVSPSALSQGLSELERRVGVELFVPEDRRRVLRPTAAPVLDHARDVVARTRDLVAWSDRLRSSRIGSVRIGMIDVAAVVHFPAVVRAFHVERPDVDLVLTVAPSAALLDELRSGHLDLVVCVEPPSAPYGMSQELLVSEPLHVLAPPGAAVGSHGSWGPWVLFPLGSHTRHQVADALRELGAPMRVAAESHQPDVLRQMVLLGLGWTVLPLSDRDEFTIGPELLRRRIVLVRRDRAIHDPAADELAARLRAARPVACMPT